MKKLLVLFLAMLVMGAALFAGPVHINGPGIAPEFAAESVFVGETNCTAVSIYQGDIAGVSAGDFKGTINTIFSRETVLTDRSAVFAVPGYEAINRGVVSPTQEVIPLSGSTKQIARNENKIQV